MKGGRVGVVSVLVATSLEPEHAARIEATDPRVTVLYQPDLVFTKH
jgi:hypothetical protein